jgi:hypothetical protein
MSKSSSFGNIEKVARDVGRPMFQTILELSDTTKEDKNS